MSLYCACLGGVGRGRGRGEYLVWLKEIGEGEK